MTFLRSETQRADTWRTSTQSDQAKTWYKTKGISQLIRDCNSLFISCLSPVLIFQYLSLGQYNFLRILCHNFEYILTLKVVHILHNFFSLQYQYSYIVPIFWNTSAIFLYYLVSLKLWKLFKGRNVILIPGCYA